MRVSNYFWVSLAAPLLVILSIQGFLHRKGNDRVQSLPAFFVGCGLLASSTFSHQRRRKNLFSQLFDKAKNHK